MVWTRNVDGSQRLVACLVALMDETDRLFPNRSTATDGSLGNAAHQAEANPNNSFGTEHVPDLTGDVRAVDITHDSDNGCDVDRLAEWLIARRDTRVLYLIRNQRILSSYTVNGIPGWTWRPYSGAAHDHHIHISTPDDPFTKADASPWWPTAAAPPALQEDDDLPPIKLFHVVDSTADENAKVYAAAPGFFAYIGDPAALDAGTIIGLWADPTNPANVPGVNGAQRDFIRSTVLNGETTGPEQSFAKALATLIAKPSGGGGGAPTGGTLRGTVEVALT